MSDHLRFYNQLVCSFRVFSVLRQRLERNGQLKPTFYLVLNHILLAIRYKYLDFSIVHV